MTFAANQNRISVNLNSCRSPDSSQQYAMLSALLLLAPPGSSAQKGLGPKLTRTSPGVRTVRTGYAYQPPACCTSQSRQLAPGEHSVRTPYTYKPRPCRTYHVLVWHHRRGQAAEGVVATGVVGRHRPARRPPTAEVVGGLRHGVRDGAGPRVRLSITVRGHHG